MAGENAVAAAPVDPAAPAPAAPAAPAPGATALTAAPAAPAAPVAPVDGKKAEPPAPAEDYELKFPEGVKVDAEQLKGFKEMAKGLGLKSDGAQKLVDFQLGREAAMLERAQKAWDAERTAWTEGLRTDKEFGGEKYDANTAVARKAIEKFGTPEFKAFLDKTGLGNHPEMVRFAFRAGRALAEDKNDAGAGGGGGAASPEAALRNMYPSMFK